MTPAESRKMYKDVRKKIKAMDYIKWLEAIPTKGLPIEFKNANLYDIVLLEDKILLIDGFLEFTLKKEQIKEVTAYEYKNLQKQLTSSAGGAIVGGVLFGAVGAVVGGQPKEKVYKDESISYLNIKYINSAGENAEVEFKGMSKPIGLSDIKKYNAFVKSVEDTYFPTEKLNSGSYEL